VSLYNSDFAIPEVSHPRDLDRRASGITAGTDLIPLIHDMTRPGASRKSRDAIEVELPPSSMSTILEDDSDPTFTHFAHRAEFLALLDQLLVVDIGSSPDDVQERAEKVLVKQLGQIVGHKYGVALLSED
jgi:hypothetical protein